MRERPSSTLAWARISTRSRILRARGESSRRRVDGEGAEVSRSRYDGRECCMDDYEIDEMLQKSLVQGNGRAAVNALACILLCT